MYAPRQIVIPQGFGAVLPTQTEFVKVMKVMAVVSVIAIGLGIIWYPEEKHKYPIKKVPS